MKTDNLSFYIRRIAKAYIFIYFGFKLNTIDILPDWAGYLMILTALPVLAEEVPSAKLLRPLGLALTVSSGITWALDIFRTGWNMQVISIIMSIINIYFHFQLITNISELDIEEVQRKRLLTLRSVTAAIHTAIALITAFLPILDFLEAYTYILLIVGIVQAVVFVYIAVILFSVSNAIRETEEEIYPDYMNSPDSSTDL